MKKRIVSIGLVVCMIFSVLTLSSVGVFAAEEVLYAPAVQEVVAAFDFANDSDDEFAANLIESENGKITVTNEGSTAEGISVVASKDKDALKVVGAMAGKLTPTVNIDIAPKNINVNASKTVTTLKFKNIYTDSEGNPITNSGDTSGVCNIEIGALGQDNDGTTVYQAGALYGTGSTWKKGTRNQHGVQHYSLATGDIPTADADGYFSLRVESYKDENGIQHTDVYGEGCTQPIVKNVYIKPDEAGPYADNLGYGARVRITYTGNDLDAVQTVWLKDVKTEYVAAKGSITSEEAYGEGIFPVTVSDDGEVSAYLKPAGGGRNASAVFSSYKPVEKGNVVIDFKLKKDPVIVNESAAGATVFRYFEIAGSENKTHRLAALTDNGAGVKSYNYDSAQYFTYMSSATVNSAQFTTDKEWASLRFVISRESVEDYWSVAMYDLDWSETVPVCTSYDTKNIGNFTQLKYSIYASGAAIKATSADPTKTCYDLRFNMKDFSMKISDELPSSAAYAQRRSTKDDGSALEATPYWSQTADKADPMSATWEGNIYVNSMNDPKVLLAVYSVDGRLLGVKMVGKEDGLKNGFNKDVVITAEGIPTTWKISKKLFIFDSLTNGAPLVKPCEDIHPDFGFAE